MVSQSRSPGLLLAVALLSSTVCALCNSCSSSPSATQVVVQLSGAVTQVQSWRVQAFLDGKQAQGITDVDGTATQFSLELPPGAQGNLKVQVQGVASFPFVISKGSGSVQAGGEQVITLPVAMTKSAVCTADNWCWERPYPSGQTITGMWAASGSDIWAVGTAGLLLHYDGQAWDLVSGANNQDLLAVYGLSSTEVYFAGGGPGGQVLLRWDGKTVSPIALPVTTPQQWIVALWASSGQDLWCASQQRDHSMAEPTATFYHFDGTAWTTLTQAAIGLTNPVYIDSIAGATAGHPWILGTTMGGTKIFLIKKDDAQWTDYSAKLAQTATTQPVASIVVKSDTDLWLAYDRKVVHFDGQISTDLMADSISSVCYWTALLVPNATEVWAAPIPGANCPGLPWRYKDGNWAQVADAGLPPGAGYQAMAQTTQDIWLAGPLGILRQYNRADQRWVPNLPESIADISGLSNLNGVAGTGPTDVWAVGGGGLVLHSDGTSWTQVKTGVTDNLNAVWAIGPQDVWAASDGHYPLHYDGTNWSTVNTGGTLPTLGVWGAKGNDVWLGGAQLAVFHWNGTAWSNVTPTQFTQPLAMQNVLDRYNISQVWGVDGQAVWMVGGRDDGAQSATVLWQYDLGTQMWTDLAPAALAGAGMQTNSRPPQTFWAAGKDNMWIGGLQWARGVSFASNTWSPASWCAPNGSTTTLWGSAPDSIWCFGRFGSVGRTSAAVISQGNFDGPQTGASINHAWSASRDELWIVGNQGVILHRKPKQ